MMLTAINIMRHDRTHIEVVSANKLDPNSICKLPEIIVDKDWFGKELPNPVSYRLGIDSSNLWYMVHIPFERICDDKINKNTYTVDLSNVAKQDCAEIFLMHPSNKSYVEFNFGPQGAWWGTKLSDYRTYSDRNFQPSGTSISAQSENIGWSVIFSLPLIELPFDIRQPGTRVHLSAIVDRPADLYISSHPLSKSEPDFHTEKVFLPLKFL